MNAIKGVGLGFRHDIASEILALPSRQIDFIEIAPENYMNIGGYWLDKLKEIAKIYPISSHGLSLSIGSTEPIDWGFLKKIKYFLEQFSVQIYSEHLSFSHSCNAHLFELLPIPFRKDAILHISDRLIQIQDFLQRPIALENVSYYLSIEPEMSEVDFINEIVLRSGCKLLLDVNNVYVNAFNHAYDPKEFIRQMPLDQVQYIHMAGHEQISDSFIVDTHGEPIIDPVYELFSYTAQSMNKVPVLLERDYNFKNFNQIMQEVDQIRSIASNSWSSRYANQAYSTTYS